jgi:hypothetical protein
MLSEKCNDEKATSGAHIICLNTTSSTNLQTFLIGQGHSVCTVSHRTLAQLVQVSDIFIILDISYPVS